MYFLIKIITRTCAGIPLPTAQHIPECLVHYSKYLKERYRAMSVFPEGEWPPSIGNRYIHLALIQHQEKFPGKESTRVVSEGCLLGRIDRIIARKKGIKIPEVFQPDLDEEGEELPLRVLVDGAPGVGKTTLCLNVCKDWADQKLLINFHLVVLLQLRQEELDSVKSIQDIFYYPDPKLQDETISTIVQSGGEGVLVILDAFDELTHEQRRKSIFRKLISGHLLPKCSVVVTSRPYASEQIQQLKCIQKHVEVLGFTDRQIQECIKQHVPDKQKGRQLAKLVKDRQDIALFCYIPLNCAILLFVYKMENYTLPGSLTQLFTLFTVNTLKRDARLTNSLGDISGLDDLPSPIQDTFDRLCTIAYNGLLNGHLVFTTKTLKQCTRVEQPAGSQLLGLMTATKSFTSMGEDISYQFLHLTIQEFLAARYVVTQLSPEEQVAFFKRNVSDDRFRVTLVFTAGLSQLLHSGYSGIFCYTKIDLPAQEMKQDYSVVLPAQETKQDNSVVQHFLFLTHLLYESQNASLCVTLASAFEEKTITLTGVNMTLFNCMTLCYFLLRSACKWRLNLGSCGLSNSSFEVFKSLSSECPEQTGGVQALKLYTDKRFEFSTEDNSFSPLALLLIPQTPLFHECHEIDLHNPSVYWTPGCVPPDSEHCLSNLLTMTHLTHLEIADLRQYDQPIVFSNLAEALTHNKTLKVLCLNNCGPLRKQSFWHNISTALGSSSLKSLTLSNLRIRGDIAIAIFEALKQNNCLKSLDVSHNEITCGNIMFEALQQNTSLESLDVSGNIKLIYILYSNLQLLEGDPRTLMDFIKYTTILHTINLSHCGITDDCVKYITAGFEQNTSLKELDISHNSITCKGVVCLFEALQKKKCLERLNLSQNKLRGNIDVNTTTLHSIDLSHCGITDDCVKYIATDLDQNTSLKELNISHNSITAKGAIFLLEALQQNECLEKLYLDGDSLHTSRVLLRTKIFQTNPQMKVFSLRSDSAVMFLHLLHSLSEKPPPSLQELHLDGYTWTPSNPLVVSSCPTERIDLLTCTDYQKLYGFILHMCAQKTPHQCCEHLRHLDFSGRVLARKRRLWLCGVIGYLLAHSSVIESLNLSNCGLDNDCIQCIAAGFQQNNNYSLKELDISLNSITAKGAICLFELLQQNKSLEKLSLDGNELYGESLVNAIELVLQTNSQLKYLSVRACGPIITLPLLLTLSEKPPSGLQELHVDGYTWTPSNPVVISSCPTERIDLLTCKDYQKLYGFVLHVCAQKTPSVL